MRRILITSLLGSAALLTAACGKDNSCDPAKADACADGLVCEQVQGAEEQQAFQCLAPVQVEGRVFDLATNAGVANARVAAVDENGAPVGGQATTRSDGTYTLRIPSVRTDAEGAPVARKLTLRAAAQDFAPFPSGIRVSLPFDVGGAAQADSKDEKSPFAFKNELTDVGLLPLPADQKGFPSISGKIEGSSALVVAESVGGATVTGFSAVADNSGAFTLFNVAPGSYSVKGFARNANYTPVDVSVAQGTNVQNVSLKLAQTPTATFNGSVNIVNPETGTATSVVLVVESTFNANLVRGEVPAGLRAPEPGTAPNITGTFSIAGIPDGRYVVLAAFENDGLVRDPDTSQGGTGIQRIQVVNGALTNTPASFKVTGSIPVVSPGAEVIDEVGPTPTFSWGKDPGTATYDLTVVDAYGNIVWTKSIAAKQAEVLTQAYDGTALSPGLYQWRVVSRDGSGVALASSEDLRGLFRVKAQ